MMTFLIKLWATKKKTENWTQVHYSRWKHVLEELQDTVALRKHREALRACLVCIRKQSPSPPPVQVQVQVRNQESDDGVDIFLFSILMVVSVVTFSVFMGGLMMVDFIGGVIHHHRKKKC